ncbi:hypothetical protein SAMN02746098_05090 [Desulfosporosinus lacus DSM 15449]|uniref:Uncharacterized protein n=1 Tax=Desulfosporosinus lacus DSM 15449 TaxID=1121420 RepID=A0A1M6G8B4_9FIRM|nr:hypothetical protein SAMN02746098_05090 [Desulfosporosinus lacus DSM 15449]
MTYQKRGKSVFVVQWARDNDVNFTREQGLILIDEYGNSGQGYLKMISYYVA